MVWLRLICTIVAIFTSLLYISDIITCLSDNGFELPKEGEQSPAMKHAAFRLILSCVMAITWAVVFIL